MKKYLIKHSKVSDLTLDSSFWKKAETAEIAYWPWHKESYTTPIVTAQLLYSNEFLYVKFHVKENFIRAQYLNYQDPVCQDSCVEFFVSPDHKEYINFEVSAIGTMLFCKGKDRHKRARLSPEYAKKIRRITSLPYNQPIPDNIECPKDGYSVVYAVPFDVISEIYNIQKPKSGDVWKGNFYKCGDETREPSWGCWNKVETDNPDFHRPEYFGELIF